MPSKKPYMQARTDQVIIDKMQHIAKNNSRSLSKEIEYICKQHIAAYEAEHGKIILPDQDPDHQNEKEYEDQYQEPTK